MLRFAFCALLFIHQTLTSGFLEAWLEEIDGPELINRTGKQDPEEVDLDFINDKRVSKTGITQAPSTYIAQSPSTKEAPICHWTASSTGINTTKWNRAKPVKVSDVFCQPYPTLLRLDSWSPRQLSFQTTFVVLHRCGGMTFVDNMHCTVEKQEEIVIITDITPQSITVYNHTKCRSDCIKRQKDCDQTKRRLNPNTCNCECIENGASCNTKIHNWESNNCACICKKIRSCDAKREWNSRICDCDCKKNVKERCKRKKKVLNQQKCECECPKPKQVCATNSMFLKHNCTCVKTQPGPVAAMATRIKQDGS